MKDAQEAEVIALSLKTLWSDEEKATTAPVNSTTSVNQVWKNKPIHAGQQRVGSQEALEGELCTAFCTMSSILPGKKGLQERKQAWEKLRERLRPGGGEQQGPRDDAYKG